MTLGEIYGCLRSSKPTVGHDLLQNGTDELTEDGEQKAVFFVLTKFKMRVTAG